MQHTLWMECSSLLVNCKNKILYPSPFDASVSDEIYLTNHSFSSQKPHLLSSVDSVSFHDKDVEQVAKFGIEEWKRQSNNLFSMVATRLPFDITRHIPILWTNHYSSTTEDGHRRDWKFWFSSWIINCYLFNIGLRHNLRYFVLYIRKRIYIYNKYV